MIPVNSSYGEFVADDYRSVTFSGGWYGPALAGVLDGLTPALAGYKPAPGSHSIAELLQHLLLWNERTRLAIAGEPMPAWDAPKDWSQPALPWPGLCARWSGSRDALEAALRAFPDTALAHTVAGRDYSFAALLAGIVQHTIWHGGQIALLRTAAQGQAKP